MSSCVEGFRVPVPWLLRQFEHIELEFQSCQGQARIRDFRLASEYVRKRSLSFGLVRNQ